MKTSRLNKSENRNCSLTSSFNIRTINCKMQQSMLSNSYSVCKVGLLVNDLNNPEYSEVNLIEIKV